MMKGGCNDNYTSTDWQGRESKTYGTYAHKVTDNQSATIKHEATNLPQDMA